MKIKLFSLEKMKENGCFMMTSVSNSEDYRALFYDPRKIVKEEEVYDNLDEEDQLEFQYDAFECFYEEELQYLPYDTIISSFMEDKVWIYIPGGTGTIMIPKLPGVLYEEC